MVSLLTSSHTYNHDFNTSTLAFLNRYPNPFAKHVLSCDTIECYMDENENLRITKFITKTGRLPNFIKPLLGDSLNSCIIEKSIINPRTKSMISYSANIDHRKFIKVEEYLHYKVCSENPNFTNVQNNVKFSSNLFGFKQKIEQWSHNKFITNMKNSREGLTYVMNQLKPID